MTEVEMIQAFKVNYDIVNLEGPGYEDEEIYVLLNQAQTIEVFKEVSLKRWTYISNLIVNEEGAVAAGLSYPNTVIYTPVAEYVGYISSKSKVTRGTFKSLTTEWVENIIIPKEISGKYLTNSINRPILLQPRVYEDALKTLTVIYDVNTSFAAGNNFYLEYVKKPVDIASGVNSEVNIVLHDRIVNTAVLGGKKVFNPNEAGGSAQADLLIDKIE